MKGAESWSGESRIAGIAWPLWFAMLVGYGMLLVPGGYLHYEGHYFLAAHLDSRDVLPKIFSAHFNEWDCYQGRELSFAAGLLDAQLIVLGARMGGAHLYSLVVCGSVFVTAVLLWHLLPRTASPIGRNLSGLVVSLFLTTPVVALSYYFYRPAKALTALFFTIVLLLIVRVQNRDSEQELGRHAMLVAAALLMALSDRVGLFLIIATIVVITIRSWPLDARRRRIVAALSVSFVLAVIWSTAGGPRMAAMVDGVWPDTGNQQIAFRYTFGNFVHLTTAISLWADQLTFQLGNWGVLSVMLPVLALAVSLSSVQRSIQWQRVAAATAAIALSVMLYTAMYAKLYSLAWPESRRVYYWIPGAVAISLAVAMLLASLLQRRPGNVRSACILIAVMIASNMLALPGHAAVVRRGEQKPQIEEAPTVRDCIRRGSGSGLSRRLSPEGELSCSSVRRAAFGAGAVSGERPVATPNPLLYCRNPRRPQPALRSLGP